MLASAAGYVHATAQHLHVQVGVALLVFAIDLLDAGLAATRYRGEAQCGVGNDRAYAGEGLGRRGCGQQQGCREENGAPQEAPQRVRRGGRFMWVAGHGDGWAPCPLP